MARSLWLVFSVACISRCISRCCTCVRCIESASPISASPLLLIPSGMAASYTCSALTNSLYGATKRDRHCEKGGNLPLVNAVADSAQTTMLARMAARAALRQSLRVYFGANALYRAAPRALARPVRLFSATPLGRLDSPVSQRKGATVAEAALSDNGVVVQLPSGTRTTLCAHSYLVRLPASIRADLARSP